MDLYVNDDLMYSQVKAAISATRASHIHRLRQSAPTIFGVGFEQKWFYSKFDRGSLPEFQKLLGVTITSEGKKYPLLPPILYPDGSPDKKTLFLNPVLVRVCTSFIIRLSYNTLRRTQILKVILFGPSSLAESGKKPPGPKPKGIQWGIQEATPGMIALAAIIVSMSQLLIPWISPDGGSQARFLLSPDEDFSQTGARTGISYTGSFNAYKDLIIAQADTPRFKRIHSEFNALLFGSTPVTPNDIVVVDRGNYDDEVNEYLREDPTPPPIEPSTAANVDEMPPSPTEPSARTDLNGAPPSPHLHRHATTSITHQESHTVTTSSQTVSITALPSEPEAEVDTPVAPPKKSRPAPRKKVASTDSVNTADATPVPTTRGTRASTRQVAAPPKPSSNTRSSGRKRAGGA